MVEGARIHPDTDCDWPQGAVGWGCRERLRRPDLCPLGIWEAKLRQKSRSRKADFLWEKPSLSHPFLLNTHLSPLLALVLRLVSQETGYGRLRQIHGGSSCSPAGGACVEIDSRTVISTVEAEGALPFLVWRVRIMFRGGCNAPFRSRYVPLLCDFCLFVPYADSAPL